MNRLFISLLLLTFTLLQGCILRQTTSYKHTTKLTFIQLNDVYEIAPIEKGKTGGMARLAALIEQYKKDYPNTYVFHAGDFLSPSVMGTLKIDDKRLAGKQMIEVMNACKIDFVAFGNHEFDLKEKELQERLDESSFQWIASNVKQQTAQGVQPFTVHRSSGEHIPVPEYVGITFPPNKKLRHKPLTIGMVGLTLSENGADYVAYENALAATQRLMDKHKDEADLWIALTHQSIQEDRLLAQKFPQMTLIMGGHEHENHYEKIGMVPIAKADANIKTVYIHHITIDRLRQTASVTSELKPINDNLPSDPYVHEIVEKWNHSMQEVFKKQGFDIYRSVATLQEPYDGLEAHIRTRPTNLGQSIAHAIYKTAPESDLALFNSNSIRLDNVLSQEITEYDVLRTLPFGGGIITLQMKGSLLKKTLLAGEANRGSGGYLQYYPPIINGGEKGWTIAGNPIEEDRVYTVTLTEYLMTGKEKNLGFLHEKNPDLHIVYSPNKQDNQDIRNDIRQVWMRFLSQ